METLDPAGEYLRLTEHYRQMSDSELLVLIPQSSQLTPLAQQVLATEVRQRGLKPEDTAAPSPPKPERPTFYRHYAPEPAESLFRDAAQLPSPTSVSSRLDPRVPNSWADASFRDPDSSCDADSPCADVEGVDSYAEARELVELCKVWSLPDALQVQTLLDRAGIPFFMGPEKATGVDAVTSSFVNGVAVQVMRIGIPWAAQALENYEPKDEPPAKPEEQPAEITVRCPQCLSPEILLEDVVSEPASAARKSPSKYRWSCDSCGARWEDDGAVES